MNLAYTHAGAGVPLVFLHGFCESKDLWTDFVKPITPSYSVICIDLPNFGESDALPDTTIEKMADAVVNTLNHLKIEKCILVGHSLGGYVGLAVAEFYPERLLGFCMFHSSAFEDNPERKEGRQKAIASIQQNGTEAFVRALIPTLFSPAQREKESVKLSINKLIENVKNLSPKNII
jgi:pimeloyl-ACP methyl ester carboxylesterase